MYRLPPIIPDHMEFDLPTRMYKLPVIQQFEQQPANLSDVSFESILHVFTKFLPTFFISQDDMKALKDLEKRQESILNQLENLKIEVSKLQQAPKSTKQTVSIYDEIDFTKSFLQRRFLRKLPSVSRDILLEKLSRLLQTLAKIDRLFSPKNHHYYKVRFT